MSPPAISVVIPVRNRSGTRLENCLASLRWQSVPADQVEIVLSDFGSDEASRADIAAIAGGVGARVAYTETAEIWNRSRALNLGIQAATGAVVLCTDADMIFAPNFLQTILDVQRSSDRPRMVHCACHDLPEAVPERRWSPDDFESLRAQAEFRDLGGTGACQAAAREFFFRVRGYDEKYLHWGAEDIDMTRRAERAGLEIEWISDRTAMLHQWHRKVHLDKKLQWKLNRWRFRLTGWIVVKNRRGWGTLR
ncbi:MAG: glycosyltransferase [Polyangiaceae bacterium]|nr:glycosyltransferase [Polyangiaceae bacterium]